MRTARSSVSQCSRMDRTPALSPHGCFLARYLREIRPPGSPRWAFFFRAIDLDLLPQPKAPTCSTKTSLIF